MYEIFLTKNAQRFYEKADVTLVRKLNHCFQQLEADPYNYPNIKALKGPLSDTFRYRLGNWRVLYRIARSSQQVVILLIVHRKNAYR